MKRPAARSCRNANRARFLPRRRPEDVIHLSRNWTRDDQLSLLVSESGRNPVGEAGSFRSAKAISGAASSTRVNCRSLATAAPRGFQLRNRQALGTTGEGEITITWLYRNVGADSASDNLGLRRALALGEVGEAGDLVIRQIHACLAHPYRVVRRVLGWCGPNPSQYEPVVRVGRDPPPQPCRSLNVCEEKRHPACRRGRGSRHRRGRRSRRHRPASAGVLLADRDLERRELP